jgi:hypothetical protein
MKKSLLFCLFIVLFFTQLKADPIDTSLARTVAKNFYLARTPNRNKSLQSVHLEYIKYTEKGNKKSLGEAIYYVFTIKDDTGFIIISADNSTVPVLAYSFNGIYQTENQVPAFRFWMEDYEKQMAYIKENRIMPDESIVNQWKALLTYERTIPLKGLSVDPLLKTTWNQGKYYNRFCPADQNGDDGHAYVGCVASAMGQIIKFWNYPASNNAMPGYYDSDYGTIPGVGATTYDWASMTDKLDENSTETEINAIATLLYHCGVAVKTDYGADASSSNSTKTQKGYINYFKYAPTCSSRPRKSYSETEWDAILKNELDKGRPIWYKADNKSVGHAFVIDGYQDESYYHFNWGWGGAYDGYFYMNALTPGSYNWYNAHLAVIGIQPNGINERIEFAGYDIVDKNPGNNNGYAEPGEQILLNMRLHNSGTTLVHNVSATISSSDADITINSNYKQLKWGDLSSGTDSIKASYVFTVLSTCISKDVPFTLNISSDEGNWIENFMVHITDTKTITPGSPKSLIAGKSFKNCIPLNWKEPSTSKSGKANSPNGLSLEGGTPVNKSGVIVESYNIYRKYSSYNYVKIANTKRLDYVDKSTSPDISYSYRVKAVANGLESAYSNAVSAICNTTGFVDTVPASSITPVIDGLIEIDEWEDALLLNITNSLGYSNTPPTKDVIAYMKKVGDLLYIGVRDYNDSTISIKDQLAIYFDNNNNDLWDAGEGNIWIVQDSTKVQIKNRGITGTYPDGLSFGTTSLNPNGINAKIGLNGKYREYEIAIDLTNSPIKPLDNNIGMYIHSMDNASGNFNAYWPDGHVWTAPQSYADVYFAKNNKIVPEKLVAGNGFKNCIPLNWRLPKSKSLKQGNVEANSRVYKGASKIEKADAEVDSFIVYRKKGTGQYARIGATTRVDYVDMDVLDDTEYNYKVKSMVDGAESGFSNEVKASCNNTGYTQDVIATSLSPTIDGVINEAEWEDATFIYISNKSGVYTDPPAKQVFAYMKRVGDYLYLAVRDSNDVTNTKYDQVGIYFDNNSNHIFETGEGNLWIWYTGTKDSIEFRGITGTYPKKLNFSSVVDNQVGVFGKTGLNGGFREYEICINLKNSTLRPIDNTFGMYILSYDGENSLENGYLPNGSVWAAPQTYIEVNFVDAFLNISNRDLNIGASSNSTKSFEITSNVAWTVSSDQSWLGLSQSSGSNNATITLTAGKNPTASSRMAIVTVSAPGMANQIINVAQEGDLTGFEDPVFAKIRVYPNPVTNLLNISGCDKNMCLQVIDQHGKVLINKMASNGQIDVSSLPNGAYIIKVSDSKSSKAFKILKN